MHSAQANLLFVSFDPSPVDFIFNFQTFILLSLLHALFSNESLELALLFPHEESFVFVKKISEFLIRIRKIS